MLNVNVRIDEYSNGRLVSTQVVHNMIVEAGRNALLKAFLGLIPAASIASFGIGDDNTATTDAFTDLKHRLFIDSVTSRWLNGNTITIQYYLYAENAETGEKQIKEAGLFLDDGTLFARCILSSPLQRTKNNSIMFTWEVSLQ